MNERKKKSNFLMHNKAKSLALIITTCLILLRMSFIASKIGANGMNYYFVPITLYALLYGVFGMGLMPVLRKQVSFQVCRGGFRNARKIYKVIATLHLVLVALISAFLFFFSEQVSVLLFHSPLYALNMKILAGAFIMVVAQRGIVGYLEGVNNAFPGIVAGYLSNLISIMTTILIQNSCINYGKSVSAFMRQDSYFYAYASLSAPIGFAVGNLFSFLFLLLIICLFRTVQSEKIKRDDTKKGPSTWDVIFTFYRVYLSEMLPLAVLPGLCFALVLCYVRVSSASTEGLGTIVMGVMLFLLLPICICYLLILPLSRQLVAIMRKQDKHHARQRIAINFKLLTYFVFPFAAFLFAVTPSIAQVLFDSAQDILIHAIRIGVLVIISVVFAIYLYNVLLCVRPKGLLNAVLYVGILAGVFSFQLFEKSQMDPMDAYIYAMFLASLLVDLIFAASLVKRLRFFEDLIRIFLLPLVAAILVGIGCFVVYKAFGAFSDLIVLTIAIILSYVIYHIVLIMTHTFDKFEWNEVPFNRIPIFLAKKLNMY